MYAECVERIVIAEAVLHDGDSRVAYEPTDKTYEYGRHRTYEAGSRCDGDKACDAAGYSAEHGRLLVDIPFSQYPADETSRCSCLSGYECVRCKCVSTER